MEFSLGLGGGFRDGEGGFGGLGGVGWRWRNAGFLGGGRDRGGRLAGVGHRGEVDPGKALADGGGRDRDLVGDTLGLRGGGQGAPEVVCPSGFVQELRGAVALGQAESALGQRGPERRAPVAGPPGRQRGGADGGGVGGGPLGLRPLTGRRRCPGPGDCVQPGGPHGLGHVGPPLAVQGGDDGAVVRPGHDLLAPGELEGPAYLLPAGVIVIHPDRYAVGADPEIDSVLVRPALLDVLHRGEGAVL